MDVIYLDFCKAFDTDPHNILLSIWEKKLVGWSHPVGSGQWHNVPTDACDKWCPSGVHIGTGAV